MKHAKQRHFNWVYTIFYLPIFLWGCYLLPRMALLLINRSSLSDLDAIPWSKVLLYVAFGSTVAALLIYLMVVLMKNHKAKKWQDVLIRTGVAQIDTLTPFEFEVWVAQVLNVLGFQAYATQKSGDYGADVIAQKDGRKIAIQVKKYQQPVGIQAVQEVVSAIGYYDCNEGWVVTSGPGFTTAAQNLAGKHHIQLVTKNDLAVMLHRASTNDANRKFTKR